MKVIVADIQQSASDSVASEIVRNEGNAIAIHLDISNPESTNQFIQQVQNRYGTLDVLINNAGIDVTQSIEDLSIADWQRIINVNLNGAFYLSKAVFKQMRDGGGGHIINIVSTAAKRAWANASAYHASKWGLLGLSQALHVEGRPHNIKVTSLIAGGMQTPFLLDRFPDIDRNTLQDPANVAETIHYLLHQPPGTVIAEMMVLPIQETSWP